MKDTKQVKEEGNPWVSFSDIMTGLMVIFMFIAITYIVEIQRKQAERDEILKEFMQTREELYMELDSTFYDKFEEWGVIFDRDLSIKFINPEVLFRSGKTRIRTRFRKILDEFLPAYFNILLKPQYRDKIVEVRIEGHTDTVPAYEYDRDPYVGNVLLSQMRATAVLRYFREMEYFKNLSPEDRRTVQFWLTANGLSYGRTIDANKNLTYYSGLPADNRLSRRVEFKLVPSSESLVEKVFKMINK